MNSLFRNGPAEGGKRRGFLSLVIVPFLACAFYVYVLAAQQYESVGQFLIKQAQNDGGGVSFDLSALAPVSNTSREDTFLIRDFIHSTDLLKALDETLDLRGHFSSPALDFVARLDGEASKESFLQYYRERVKIYIEPESNIVTLRVRAFEPEVASAIMEKILEEGEAFVNQISQDLAEQQVNFVRREVNRAEENLRSAREQMIAFQNRRTLLNPESSIESMISIIAGMEAEAAQKKATLRELRSYLQEDSFQVTSLQNQIDALESQIEAEKQRLTGSPDVSLNQLMAEFQKLSLELEFATNAYSSAFTTLEASQIEASRELKNMVVISNSGVPEDASYPRALYTLATALIVLLLVYGIGKLIVATINDHME